MTAKWVSGEGRLLGYRLTPSLHILAWQKEVDRDLWGSFYKDTNPTDKVNHLSRQHLQNTITSGVGNSAGGCERRRKHNCALSRTVSGIPYLKYLAPEVFHILGFFSPRFYSVCINIMRYLRHGTQV